MISRGGKSKDKSKEAARRHPRHSGKNKVRCLLGDVLDLSAGGMRIACSGKPPLKAGSAAKVDLRTNEGQESVNVRCCWVRKTGLFKGYQIGLKFIGITEEQSGRIGKIAQYGFLPEADPQAQAQSGSDDSEEESAGISITAELDLGPYYQALELEDGAEADEIRDAYRRLVRTCHPDVNDAPEAEQQFLELQEAYDILRKRANAGKNKAA